MRGLIFNTLGVLFNFAMCVLFIGAFFTIVHLVFTYSVWYILLIIPFALAGIIWVGKNEEK